MVRNFEQIIGVSGHNPVFGRLIRHTEHLVVASVPRDDIDRGITLTTLVAWPKMSDSRVL